MSTPEVPYGLSIGIFMFDLGLFKNLKVMYISTVDILQAVKDIANIAILTIFVLVASVVKIPRVKT